MAELADALDLGSSVPDVKVQVLSGAPKKRQVFTCRFFILIFKILYQQPVLRSPHLYKAQNLNEFSEVLKVSYYQHFQT